MRETLRILHYNYVCLRTVNYDSCQWMRLERVFGKRELRIPLMKNDWKYAIASICAVLLVRSALCGEEKCSVEIKLLISPPKIQTVIIFLNFKNETGWSNLFFRHGCARSPEARGDCASEARFEFSSRSLGPVPIGEGAHVC